MVVTPDLTGDLHNEDASGYVWTFLDEALDPGLIVPGAIVVVDDTDAPAVAQVVDVIDKPAGKVVHLRLLPGSVEDDEALVQRAGSQLILADGWFSAVTLLGDFQKRRSAEVTHAPVCVSPAAVARSSLLKKNQVVLPIALAVIGADAQRVEVRNQSGVYFTGDAIGSRSPDGLFGNVEPHLFYNFPDSLCRHDDAHIYGLKLKRLCRRLRPLV